MRTVIMMRPDLITEEHFQVRKDDGQEFMFYKVATSDGTELLFHQPWRNVKAHYRPYEYQRMKVNAEEYVHVPYPEADIDEPVDVLLAKYYLAVNCARIRIYRWYYKIKDNCPDEHWREIAREIY